MDQQSHHEATKESCYNDETLCCRSCVWFSFFWLRVTQTQETECFCFRATKKLVHHPWVIVIYTFDQIEVWSVGFLPSNRKSTEYTTIIGGHKNSFPPILVKWSQPNAGNLRKGCLKIFAFAGNLFQEVKQGWQLKHIWGTKGSYELSSSW